MDMKSGQSSEHIDINSTTMLFILLSICIDKIHKNTLDAVIHRNGIGLKKDDIEYAVVKEWVTPYSFYNELKPFMELALNEGEIVEIPDKYKEVVMSRWEVYSNKIIECKDDKSKLAIACSELLCDYAIGGEYKDGEGDDVDDGEGDDFEDGEGDDFDDGEGDDFDVGGSSIGSYKDCTCVDCIFIKQKSTIFMNINKESLGVVDRIVFESFVDLIH